MLSVRMPIFYSQQQHKKDFRFKVVFFFCLAFLCGAQSQAMKLFICARINCAVTFT